MRVDGAGRVTSTRSYSPGEIRRSVGVAARHRRSARAVPGGKVDRATPDLFLQRFTAAGEPLIERKPLHEPQLTYYGFSPAVGRGGDTVMLLGKGPSLGYGSLTADGDFSPATQAIAQRANGFKPNRGHQSRVRRRRRLAGLRHEHPGIQSGMHFGVARLRP